MKHRKLKVKIKQEIVTGMSLLCLFLSKLIITTIMALTFHDTSFHHFHLSISDMLRTNIEDSSLNSYMQYKTITRDADWWLFVEQIVQSHLYDENQGIGDAKRSFSSFWKNNLMIGVPKLRQIRVREGTCFLQPAMNRYFNDCYARYSPRFEETTKMFKSTPYMTYDIYPVQPLVGIHTVYRGPGYVQFMTHSKYKNLEILKNLKSLKWIDRGTRLLVLEFQMYNLNMNTFISLRFITEKLATGNLLVDKRIDIIPLHSIWSERTSPLTLGTVLYFLIIFSISREIWLFIRLDTYTHIRNIWTWFNWLYLGTSYFVIYLSLVHVYELHGLADQLKDTSDEVFMDSTFKTYYRLKTAMGVCAILIWLKLFRFITINRTMLNFSSALRKGANDIVGFSVMFSIVFIAFATMGLLCFSGSNPSFCSLKESLVTMMRMIMTDFQYENLEKADKLFGPIFFVVFILFIYFVLLNTFLAVISETYVSTYKEDQHKYSPVRVYYTYIKNAISDFIKKRKENKGTSEKKDGDFESPRNMNTKEAIKEYFGNQAAASNKNQAPSNMDSDSEGEEEQRNKAIAENKKQVGAITNRVKQFEQDLEHLIEKMDNILHKVEVMANEAKEKS